MLLKKMSVNTILWDKNGESPKEFLRMEKLLELAEKITIWCPTICFVIFIVSLITLIVLKKKNSRKKYKKIVVVVMILSIIIGIIGLVGGFIAQSKILYTMIHKN